MVKKTKSENQNENENRVEELAPQYITHRPEFSCPLTPSIMWHHGFYYKECPLKPSNRDMPQCSKCKLRWAGLEKSNKNNRGESKRDFSSTQNTNKEEIPTIGKTYSSE